MKWKKLEIYFFIRFVKTKFISKQYIAKYFKSNTTNNAKTNQFSFFLVVII